MNAILAIVDAVLNSLWQAVIVGALVWLSLKFLPRMFNTQINAATRCAIWWAALAVVLVLPVAPRVIKEILPAHRTVALKPQIAPGTELPETAEVEPIVLNVTPDRISKWPLAVFAIWIAILLFRLAQIGRSYIYLRGVKRRAAVSPIPLPASGRRADLLISRDVLSPMAVGFLRPAVILPESLLAELSEPEREHVLLHEMAHLAGYDDWSNLLMRVLGGAVALHPVAVWILRRIEREREMVCDDWAVSRTTAARPYAATLARMFELRWARRNEVLAPGLFGRGARVGDRIEMLLRRGRTFSPRASGALVTPYIVALSVLLTAAALTPRWIAFAQLAPRPAFDAASIKRSLSSEPGPRWRLGPHTYVESATLKDVVLQAYDVKDFQVSGGPGWINSDRYDSEATLAGTAARGEERQRLQTLLQDRFKFTLRRETKELPIYELTVAKSGLKLLPLKDGSCVPFDVDKFRAQGSDPMNFCGFGGFGRGMFEASSASMGDLANSFSTVVGRIVVDKTGIAAAFRVRLKFSPDESMPGFLFSAGGSADHATETDGGSFFASIQDQLGLKLESAKGPVEMLVIDHVEKPDGN